MAIFGPRNSTASGVAFTRTKFELVAAFALARCWSAESLLGDIFMLSRLVSVVLLLGAAPALAQTQQADQPKPKKDPGRVICEKQEVIGSRLATRRICMTAEQWAEKRRMDRELLESHQRAPEPGR